MSYPSLTATKKLRIANIERIKDYKNDGELIKFFIRQKFGTDIPINTNMETYNKGFTDDHYKVEKYLVGSSDRQDGTSKLCHLYDDYLTEIPDKEKNE